LPEDDSILQAINETIRIESYDAAWPGRFEAERARLVRVEPLLLAIEHIGSTAVPGMAAKPVIDVMATVASMEVADQIVERLGENGYATSAEFNRSLGDRRWLMRQADGRRTHHLHLVLPGSVHWVENIRFRDALRGNRQLADEYAAVKRELAGTFSEDREGYTAAKGAFIAAALQRGR
jgi:GrpB-like predicted nucleotidyltransferase (UPF0157 family)